jgi:protein-tyrosine phosphatase
MACDVTFIYSQLAIGGGIYTEGNMKEIAALGITHILDCQGEWDDTPVAAKFGIKVLWLPVFDDWSAPNEWSLKAALKFVDESIIKTPHKAKLLVHCAGGVHRGPMFALLAALRAGEDSMDAVRKMQYFRRIANFPSVYRTTVEQFIEKQSQGGKLSGS